MVTLGRRSIACLGRERRGILAKKLLQLGVQARVPGAKGLRPLEKRFSRDGKELGGIGGSITIEHGAHTGCICPSQRIELRAHHPRPREILGTRVQCWRPVGIPVLEIELMSKFVEHDIPSIGWIGRAVPRRIPRQDERPQMTACVSEPSLGTFLPYSSTDVPLLVGRVSGGIDEDRRQLGVVVSVAVEKKEARLRGDCDSHFIGELESATPFEIFFIEKNLNVAEQLRAIVSAQPAENRNISFEELFPFRGERLRAKARPAA